MKKRFLIAVLALLCCIAAPAMAKEGLYVGAFVPSEKISGSAAGGSDSGSGWGLRAGIGANRYFAIEANYATTQHSALPASVDLESFAGDIKVNFPLTSLDSAQVMTLEPYVLFGFAHYEKSQAGATYKSDGPQWGVGVELYLFRELSIETGWTTTNVKFNEPVVPASPLFVDKEGHVQRLEFGITYHFI
jgi:hypothetical protein